MILSYPALGAALVLVLLLHAPPPAAAVFTTAEKQTLVDMHNEDRRNVGRTLDGTTQPAASDMLLMVWDDEIAKTAQAYADGCPSQHNPQNGANGYGENLAWGSPSRNGPSAMKGWTESEMPFYTYKTKGCKAGEQCGHYTQVVWAKSYKVGCGIKRCSSIAILGGGGGDTIVCNYSPPGNYNGNHPYKEGAACSACAADETCITGLCAKPGTGAGVVDPGSSSSTGAGGAAPGTMVPTGSTDNIIAAAVLLPIILIALLAACIFVSRRKQATAARAPHRGLHTAVSVLPCCVGHRSDGLARKPCWPIAAAVVTGCTLAMSAAGLALMAGILTSSFGANGLPSAFLAMTSGAAMASRIFCAFALCCFVLAFVGAILACVKSRNASKLADVTPAFVAQLCFFSAALGTLGDLLAMCLFGAFGNDTKAGAAAMNASLLCLATVVLGMATMWMALVSWELAVQGGASGGAGWTKNKDPTSGKSYYHNKATGETQWEKPAAAGAATTVGVNPMADGLPSGWTTAVDKSSGKTYYFCAATGETSWDMPSGRQLSVTPKGAATGF